MCKMLNFLIGLGATTEKPSPSDIVPRSNITRSGAVVLIDYGKPLHIPFTKPPKILPIMEIPDTNSMDGLMDYGHNPLYIEPTDEENHRILCDWLASQWIDSKGMLANDCVYRIPADWSQPAQWYVIHRIYKVGVDRDGRYWVFKGFNNPTADPCKVRDENIMWLNTGVIF